MKNNRWNDTLSVSVTLYFASGERYDLQPLQLGPRQNAVISLNHLIESLPPAMAARAGQEGTAEVAFQAESAAALMGGISVTNPERGLAWNFRLYPRDTALGVFPVRGLFWLNGEQADGFVAVQNASEESLTLTPRFHIATQTYPLAAVSLAAGQGFKFDIRSELRSLPISGISAGGIEFIYDGPPDALKAHGVLFDNHGFSTEIDFNPFEQWPESRTVTLRTPRFALGAADPTLGLSPSTRFDSFLLLHNFNAHSLPVNLSVGYRIDPVAQEVQIPLSLAAGENRVVSLGSLLGTTVPEGVHWAWLELSYSDRHNGLVASLVSVTQDGEHSLRSVLNWVEGNAGEGWYWRADANYNTFIGILNTDTEEAHVAVSLDYYADGQRHSYDLPERTLPPRASDSVDVGAVIAAAVPDTDGDVIPSSVAVGGYGVRKVGPRSHTVLTTEALLINRQTKAYETYYNTCCPLFSVSFAPTGLTGIPGGYGQITITGRDNCSGAQFDLTSSGSYTSRNPAVAAMSGSAGQVSYVSPGSTAVDACVQYRVWKAFINPCYVVTTCDDTPTGVKPTVTISGSPNVPLRAAGSTGPNSIELTATGNPAGGSYNWSTTSTKVTLSNTTSAKVTVTSQAESAAIGDVPVSVTYTLNNQPSDPAVANITVVKPTSLQLVSDTTTQNGHLCDPASPTNFCDKSGFSGSGSYTSYRRDRVYRILDRFNRWIQGFGLQIQESYTPPTGQCSGALVITAPPFSGDTIFDCFYFCSETCRTGGSCNVSATQTITVNGFVVGTKNVNWTCAGVSVQ